MAAAPQRIPLRTPAALGPIRQWLASVNSLLEQYAEALVDSGCDDSSMLLCASTTTEDINEAAAEAGMKKFHKRTFMRAVAALRGDGGGHAPRG